MVADGMLTRKRYREVPPRVDYELTERARELMPILGELARWGYEWAWSSPRSSESIDLGAIFRLAPGLVRASRLSGKVEATVREDGQTTTYTLTLSEQGATVLERPAGADATVSGTRSAWIDAFSPGGDRGGLKVGGKRELAEALLDELTPVASREIAARDVA